MAEKKLDYPVIKCKDIEILEGGNSLKDLSKFPIWIMEVDDAFKVVMDADKYKNLIDKLEKLESENFEMRLEKAIFSEFPVDYEDVKAVVLEELKKDSSKDVKDIVEKIKLEHPNLFYKLDLDLDKQL